MHEQESPDLLNVDDVKFCLLEDIRNAGLSVPEKFSRCYICDAEAIGLHAGICQDPAFQNAEHREPEVNAFLEDIYAGLDCNFAAPVCRRHAGLSMN